MLGHYTTGPCVRRGGADPQPYLTVRCGAKSTGGRSALGYQDSNLD
ncbi:hypothetical protein [Ornithinimicrobium kibberense]